MTIIWRSFLRGFGWTSGGTWRTRFGGFGGERGCLVSNCRSGICLMAFEKGKSGNPNGRPKVLLPDGRSLSDVAKAHTMAAIDALVEVLTDDEAPHAAKIGAANALLDRGWGKPAQAVQLTGEDGGPLAFSVIERVVVDPKAK